MYRKIEIKKVRFADLKPNPFFMHEALAGPLVVRVKRFKEILGEVEPMPLEKTIDDFRRDMHPEREVAIWEKIAEGYNKHVSSNPSLSLKEKRKVYADLLIASMGEEPIMVGRVRLKRN